MDSNLTTLYLAIETERARLPRQAERGWLAEQTTGAHPTRPGAIAIRRRIGRTMISAGRWVQGMPEAPRVMVGPSRTS